MSSLLFFPALVGVAIAFLVAPMQTGLLLVTSTVVFTVAACRRRACHDTPSADAPAPDNDDAVDWADVPLEVRRRIGPSLPPGHTVRRCRRQGPRGHPHVEWWWTDAAGDLVDAFWAEQPHVSAAPAPCYPRTAEGDTVIFPRP